MSKLATLKSIIEYPLQDPNLSHSSKVELEWVLGHIDYLIKEELEEPAQPTGSVYNTSYYLPSEDTASFKAQVVGEILQVIQSETKHYEEQAAKERREKIAVQAMNGILAAQNQWPGDYAVTRMITLSVQLADALIRELDK